MKEKSRKGCDDMEGRGRDVNIISASVAGRIKPVRRTEGRT